MHTDAARRAGFAETVKAAAEVFSKVALASRAVLTAKCPKVAEVYAMPEVSNQDSAAWSKLSVEEFVEHGVEKDVAGRFFSWFQKEIAEWVEGRRAKRGQVIMPAWKNILNYPRHIVTQATRGG